jgi:hypothetical protein
VTSAATATGARDVEQPISDQDDRSATPATVEARRFFDELFRVAMGDRPEDADGNGDLPGGTPDATG